MLEQMILTPIILEPLSWVSPRSHLAKPRAKLLLVKEPQYIRNSKRTQFRLAAFVFVPRTPFFFVMAKQDNNIRYAPLCMAAFDIRNDSEQASRGSLCRVMDDEGFHTYSNARLLFLEEFGLCTLHDFVFVAVKTTASATFSIPRSKSMIGDFIGTLW